MMPGSAPASASALTVLWPHDDPSSHLLLPEPPEDDAPIVRVGTDALADLPDGAAAGRYLVLGEIARGGMGVVLKARDVQPGRDLALKVLQTRYRGDPDVVSRFVEEARIGGQLQHPGIVPVHELGTLGDRRPYFTMKLVKGRTLAALLQERVARCGSTDPVGWVKPTDAGRGHPGGLHPPYDDLPRFLAIFEQVCQTVAYAHARRVIHRDLKPANVMVGSFGEVQVVDWGLAKVLPEGGIADEAKAMEREETVILTARSGPAGSDGESQPGSVLGTPSYMAPEQARGEIDRIDERADVFGLGAILCEILTGRPTFGGSSRHEIRARAARGDLADALGRLDSCGADAELVELAKDCLAVEPAQRPRNAGEVARRMSAYQAGVQDRLRAAELARVEAQTRAAEERKRRRVTVALAASILGLFSLGGGVQAYMARERAERLAVTARVVAEALAEAERLGGQAQEAAGDLSKWAAAVSAARHAGNLLRQGEANAALRFRVTSVLAGLERERAAAEEHAAEVQRDRRLLDDLEVTRAALAEHLDLKWSDAQYAETFRRFGIDLDELEPEVAGRQIARRSQPVEIASFLDDWAAIRRKVGDSKDETPWRRLLAAAQVADSDFRHHALREQIGRNECAALRRLADDPATLDIQPASSLVLLATALNAQDDRDRAERILRHAWRSSPNDFWLNFELGFLLDSGIRPAEQARRGEPPELARLAESARFWSVAVAIRPHSPAAHNNLGLVLDNLHRTNEAITEFRTAVRLKPDFALSHNNLGGALYHRWAYEEAIAEYRTALRLKPNYANAHSGLGSVLARLGKLDEAIAEFDTALRLKPEHIPTRVMLGLALCQQRKLDKALVQFGTAIRLNPDSADAHYGMGEVLRYCGKAEESLAEYRIALQHRRDFPQAHNTIAIVLGEWGKFDEAIAELLAALRLDPEFPHALENLGIVSRVIGNYSESIASLRRAYDLAKVRDPHASPKNRA